jgi:Ketosteroid isomerase homolog
MKKIFLTLILSFAILSCETPNEEANSDLPTVIDDTELVAIADAMYEAMNSDDVDSVLNFYADEASWSFPNGVNIEGKEAIGQMLATTTSIWDITRRRRNKLFST